MKRKAGKDLVVGDRIEAESGWVKLTRVGPGMQRNTRLLHWGAGDDEWASIPNDHHIQVK